MRSNISLFAAIISLSASLLNMQPAAVFAEETDVQDVIYSCDFENGNIDKWNPFGGNGILSTDTSAAHSGESSLKISGRQHTYEGPSLSENAMFQSGETYTFSGWVYHDTDSPKDISWTIKFLDSLGITSYEHISDTQAAPGEWSEMTGTVTFPEDIVSVMVYFECSNASSDFNIDDITITGKSAENEATVQENDGYVYSFDFEKNTEQWTPRGDNRIIHTDEFSNTGKYSIYTTNRTRTWNGPTISINDRITRGKSYNFSAYVMYNGEEYENSHVFRLELQYTIDGTEQYELVTDKVVQKNKWTKLAADYIVPEKAENLYIYIQTENTVDDAEPTINDLMSFYVDTVRIADSAFIKRQNTIKTIKIICVVFAVSAIVIIIAALLLKRSKKNKAALELASKDAMTHAFNRNTYEKYIRELEKNPEKCKALYFALCDVNFLKFINDNHGHKQGDEAIIRCAEMLMRSVDSDGKIYRTGGDEFVCISEKPIEERIRLAAKEETAIDKNYPFSVALGFSEYNAEIDGNAANVKSIINRCDKEMYKNKQEIKAQNTKYSRS